MRAKIIFILMDFLLLCVTMVFYSCENPEGGDPVYKGMFQGSIYDDSTRLPLSGVKVWADGITDTLTTNDSGKFHFTKITMPKGEFNYYFIFQKTGYNDKTITQLLNSNVLVTIDTLLMKRAVKLFL
jgi:hypothetical protein